MPPINVFVAYVDTYIGKQLLHQFLHKPSLFTVYGCTWAEGDAEAQSAQALADYQQVLQSLAKSEAPPPTGGVTVVPELDSVDGGIKGTPTVSPPSTISSPTGTVAATGPAVEGGELFVAGEGAPHSSSSTASFPTVAASSSGTASPCSPLKQSTVFPTPPQFFWRGDNTAVRRGLATCDWIIVEQRMSEEVLNILHFLQTCTFERPKRLVLLSSFMTWYATPPLSDPQADMEPEEEPEMDLDEEDVEEEVNAPYPPPPEEPEAPPSDDEEFGAVAEGGEDDEKEVLTEDQYNRRIPHAKFYNWRDAEKAVAAAHHAKGLPLETFVVFAGLPYGEGEDALEPIFRQAWSGASSHPELANGMLPIYGDGSQCVPMVHVRDLAFFTHKLLRVPTAELPTLRYLFVTDGARLTWRSVIETINHSFGNRCQLVSISPSEFGLHSNVEQFTVDLRVGRRTMEAIMEREDDVGLEEGRTFGPVIHRASNTSAFISEGGLRRNMEQVALEFRFHRHVTPLRVAILGPPAAGKKYLADHLGKYYKLPSFSVEDTVETYKAHLETLRASLQAHHDDLITNEKKRRLDIKKHRLIYAHRPTDEEKEEETQDEDEEDGSPTTKPEQLAAALPVRVGSEDDIEERDAQDFLLTEEEVKEAEDLMEERFESSAKTLKLRNEISDMERVLLMRVQQRTLTSDANPKRRASATKKKLTREQQRRKDEEELQQAKEALRDAPFQDKALALMLRWRLNQPDCRNEGYLLHGFPRTVEQARLTFGSQTLSIPLTEEEALNPPVVPEDSIPGVIVEENEEGEEVIRRIAEPSDEKRLPDHVIVLQATENFLLDRLSAMAGLQTAGADAATVATAQAEADVNHALPPGDVAAPQLVVASSLSSPAGKDGSAVATSNPPDGGRDLARFYEHLITFNQQFIEARYSLLSYWDCATSDPGVVTVGGRTVKTHICATGEKEPLVPPPPPASAFELPQVSETELSVRGILGPPHNFRPTPLEVHQEEVRLRNLEHERLLAQQMEAQRMRELEAAVHQQAQEKREQTTADLLQVKVADFKALEERKEPLRAYLMKNVIPLLSKGLVEVCAQHPDKPIDFLSEWLLRHNPHDDVFSDL